MKHIQVTPTITAGAYSALDALGGKLEFENACTPYSASGSIVRAYIKDKAKQNALLYLVLFNQDFTATADNGAFDVTDADLANVIGILEFSVANYASFDDNSVGTLGFAGAVKELPFVLEAGGTSLFGQLFIKTSTPTYATTGDVTVELIIK